MKPWAVGFILSFLLSASQAYPCTVKADHTQDCNIHMTWEYPADNDGADGFKAQKQLSNGSWVDAINPIPKTARQADDLVLHDVGETHLCYRLFAFNSTGLSDPDSACTQTPFINLVTLKTQGIVTTSHRATDTSSIIAILVNQNTVIGPGGLELVYPSKYTLTVSRRASNTSSVIAILVNKSTQVMINP